jgi:ketosteroid isomerase-like protein
VGSRAAHRSARGSIGSPPTGASTRFAPQAGAPPLFSRRDDVTVGNPFGPFVRGWEQVSETVAGAATYYRDGEVTRFERVATYATADLACVVEVEQFRAKIGGSDELSSVALRVTSVVRREGDDWRIVNRHADPITTERSPESVAQRD